MTTLIWTIYNATGHSLEMATERKGRKSRSQTVWSIRPLTLNASDTFTVNPGETASLHIEGLSYSAIECYLEISFTLRESTSWAKAGFEVAFGQSQLVPPTTLQIVKELS